MAKTRRSRTQKPSIKDGQTSIRGGHAEFHKNAHIGNLMRKYRDQDEVLYPLTINCEYIYEDMDYTIEEFAEIVGCDLQDLIEDLIKAAKK